MKFSFQSESALVEESSPAPLDLVVPVTTPELTRASIKAAEHLAAGLKARIHLLRIQIVPYPLDIASPPVPVDFIREQMDHYVSALPLERELKLARDFDSALLNALDKGSVVMLSAKKRPWRTRNERLADSLRRAGHPVILTFEGENHA
jgi:hypothetical protein